MSSIEKLLSLLGAVSAPVLTLLTHTNVLSSLAATDIGSIVAALIVGYHSNTVTRTVTASRAANKAGKTL